MICSQCKNKIHMKVSFKNFFQTYEPRVCRACFKKVKQAFPYFVIPIQGGLLHIIERLTTEPKNFDEYLDYFAPYVLAYLELNLSIDMIYVETLDIEFIKILDELNVGHLIILTNKFKEELYL